MEKEIPMGRRKQRSFEARFKEEAVRLMLSGESIMRLSRELDVARAVLSRIFNLIPASRPSSGLQRLYS